jgi:hypothetical protein
MTLYLLNGLSSTEYTRPSARHSDSFQAEMAVQMKINNKLAYQGLILNGYSAHLCLARVKLASDVFASHKTDTGTTTYTFPEHRNVFVADMVKLVRHWTDDSALEAHCITQ